jgi:hypothetical protein
MSRLSQVQSAFLRNLLAYVCMSKVTLAINAGSAATVKTTGGITYTSDGRYFTASALSAQVLTVNTTVQPWVNGQTTLQVQPVSTTAYYVIALDSAGSCWCIQGTWVGYSGPGANPIIGDGTVPEQLGSLTPIGMFKLVTDASHTFTPATTALDAAGITVTYYDLMLCPSANP